MRFVHRLVCLACCAYVATILTAIPARAAVMYEVIPLQQTAASTAMAVNNLGQVAGYDTTFNGGLGTFTYNALRWNRDGVRTQLAANNSRAVDINDAGQTLVNSAGQQLFIYPLTGPSKFIVDYGTIDVPAARGSINGAGDAGTITQVNGGTRYWFAGSGGGSGGIVILPQTIGFSPEGIAPGGTLFGIADGSNRPALATTGGITREFALPAPFVSGVARGANDAGEIIGTAQTATTNGHGFYIDRDGDFHEFTSPAAGYGAIAPRAINADGDIVGVATASGGGLPLRPYLLRNGALEPLNGLVPATWTIYDVIDISDTGYILATGQLTGLSGSGPVLLRPVPEPSIAVTSALLLFLAAGRRGGRTSGAG